MVNTGNTNTILHTPIPRTTTHRFCQLTNNELSFRHATCLSQLPAQSLSLVFSLSLSPSPSLFFLLYDSLQGNFVLSCLFSWTSSARGHLHPPFLSSLNHTIKSMLFSRPPVRLSWTSAFRSIRKIPLPCARFFSISVPRFTADMGTVDTSERLSKLRQLMREHKVDVYSMTSSYLPLISSR